MFQDIAFYHTTDKQGAFAITLDRTTPANTQTQLVSKKNPPNLLSPKPFIETEIRGLKSNSLEYSVNIIRLFMVFLKYFFQEGVLVSGKDAFVLEPNGPLGHSLTPAHNHRIMKRSSYINSQYLDSKNNIAYSPFRLLIISL